MAAWNVTGVIATQSSAHNRLMHAISEGRAFEIWMGNCKIATCASLEAAKAYIGKSKRYTIKQQTGAAS